MDALVFVRRLNSHEYNELGKKKFSVLPRMDEFISVDAEGKDKYFQVIAVHHVEGDGDIEVYAVQTEPTWLAKKGRAIGFGS